MLVICPHCAKPHEVEAKKVLVRPTDEELIEFDIFRDNYKGKKRGLLTEMDNFIRHKDWRDVLPILNRLHLDFGRKNTSHIFRPLSIKGNGKCLTLKQRIYISHMAKNLIGGNHEKIN